MSVTRQRDELPAARFIEAMKSLTDDELVAVCAPLVDLQELLAAEGIGRLGFPLVSVIENEKCVEFYDSIGMWVLDELRYRHETLSALDSEPTE